MIVAALTRAGCDVLVAHTGKKGMELAQENKFDLIALDVGLPDINGFEICSKLKQRHLTRLTPIIFVSARPCEQDSQQDLEARAADYIIKPFGASEFVSRVLSCIKSARARYKTNPLDVLDESADTDAKGFCKAT